MSDALIRLLLVDDHPVVRRGMLALFADVGDIHVVGEAANGIQAIEQVALLRPDVVLMDLVMPEMDGIEATKQIAQRWPETHVLVLTNFALEDQVLPAFKAGAVGYLTKEAEPLDLVRAIRDVHHGQSPIQPSVARKVLREWTGQSQTHNYIEALTKRERDVLALMVQGLRDNDIAERLGIGEVTVRTHINHVIGKLQATSRVQAVLWAVRAGVFSSEASGLP